MRTCPIPVFVLITRIISLLKKRWFLGVGVPQRLVDAEGLTLLDSLPVLVDLLLRELHDELEAWLDILDRLRLEQARSDRFRPDFVPLLGADEDRGPAVGAPDRAGRDVGEVGNIVEADVAAGLLVLVGHLDGQGDDVSALRVDPELALPDRHLLHGAEVLARVIFDKGLHGLVREVLHAEEPYCKGDLARNIPHVDGVELSLPDRLHLAADTGDPDLVEAEGPGRLLKPGNLGADVVLRALCLEDVLAAHRDERPGLPGPVALACHNGSVDDPLFEGVDHEGGGDAAVLCLLQDLLVRAPSRDTGRVFAEIWICNHLSHLT